MAKTGKIFSESSNVYQDEAKILFNYYQQCAEKIVNEEERIEKVISELNEDHATVEASMTGWWNKLINFILFRTKRLQAQLDAIDEKIASMQQEHKNIFRGYKMNKLGVAYVPVADQVKYEDKSFIVDYSGNVPHSQVSLQMSRQNALLGSTIQELAQMANDVPLVETGNDAETVDTDQYSLSIQEINQNDYIGKMDRALRTISFCMNDLETASVELPLVQENSDYLHYLEEYATSDVPKDAPVFKVFDKERYEKSVNKFQELNKLKDSLSSETEQFEVVLQNLMMTIANSVQTISAKKLATTDKLINSSNQLLFKLLKSPYNHYSPLLEAEEIKRIREEKFDYSDNAQGYDPFTLRQSSRVYYNLFTDGWVAEDGSQTNVPFGIHQIYEEIVAPVVQNLMEENRIERLKIYNHIHDQKLNYVNKWHQDVDAFYRSNHAESADIINNMQKTLSEYIEAYNILAQLEKTVGGMEIDQSLDSTVVKAEDKSADTLAAFELQANEFRKVQEEFTDFMDRLQDDISLKAEEFGHVEYYDGRLRDGYSNEMAVASSEVLDLDERRKVLANTNPLLAKESDMPPAPSIENLTYEHLSINLPAIAQNSLEELDNMVLENVAPVRSTNVSSDDDLPELPSDDEDLPELPSDDELPELPSDDEDLPELPSDDELPELPSDDKK